MSYGVKVLQATDQFKETVRQKTDLVALVGESVSLQSRGGGREFMGLCPFHEDHDPSLRVYPDRQSYRCWACNAGDCFTWVMEQDKVGFREAGDSGAAGERADPAANGWGAG